MQDSTRNTLSEGAGSLLDIGSGLLEEVFFKSITVLYEAHVKALISSVATPKRKAQNREQKESREKEHASSQKCRR